MSAPSPDELAPILSRHGFRGMIEPMAVGYVNWVYAIGEDAVLRVTKPEIGAEDTYTEAVAVPAVIAAGVRTPNLLVFDDSQKDVPFVYTIYERAAGEALATLRVDQGELPTLYRELGEEVALIHNGVTCVDDPSNWLDRPYFYDPRIELEAARRELTIELVSYDWLSQWIEALAPAIERQCAPRFLHNDLHAGNTMVFTGPLRLSAVIDWGDACWGDPVLDMERVPIWALPWLLETYKQ